MDKVQKHNSFNTITPPSESYRNYNMECLPSGWHTSQKIRLIIIFTHFKSLLRILLEATNENIAMYWN
jgi:hypothetical protein